MVEHGADRPYGKAVSHRLAHIDQQDAHTLRRFRGLIAQRRTAEQDHEIRMLGPADPDLLARNHIAIPFATRKGGDTCGIRTRSRLSDPERLKPQLARSHLWEIFRLLRS